MSAILYYSRNPNPRLAVAVSRHLNAPVTLKWCAPFHPDHEDFFRKLTPARRIPILVENDHALWEADAIACRLSQMVGSDFWRGGAELPEMIRWISWRNENFVRACDIVHFERGTKLRYGLGPFDPLKHCEGLQMFAEAAAVLGTHLAGRDWILGRNPSYTDFRMASFLPFNDVAALPVEDTPTLAAWLHRLETLPSWADPFAGLGAPPLPPIPATVAQA